LASEGSAASNGEQTRSCSQELESRLEFEKGKKKQEDSAILCGQKWINSASQSFTSFTLLSDCSRLFQDCSKTVPRLFDLDDLDDLALGAGKQEANAPAEEGTR